MDEEAGFLAAIRAEPAADLPRLAYADWLDEHAGTVRCPACHGAGRVNYCGRFMYGCAELGVECACQDSKLCERCTGRKETPDERAARAAEIRDAVAHPDRISWFRDTTNVAPWVAADLAALPIEKFDWGVGYRRGFVERLICSGAAWRFEGDAMLARFPITRVLLTTLAAVETPRNGRWRFLDRSREHWVPRGEGFEHTARNICLWMCRQEWPDIAFGYADAAAHAGTAQL